METLREIKGHGPQVAIRYAAHLLLTFGPLTCVVLISSWHWDSDYTYYQWAAGFFLMSLFTIARLSKSWLVLPYAYFLFRPGPYFAGLDAYRIHLNPAHYMASVGGYALYQFMALSLIPIFLFSLTEKESLRLKDIFLWTAVFNAVYVLVGIPTTGYPNLGFAEYSGINGCLLATQLPLALEDPRKWIITPILCAAILFSSASIPIGLLVVAVVSYSLLKMGRGGFKLSIMVIAFSCLMLNCLKDSKPFDDAKRFQAYRLFMGTWNERQNRKWGEGPGTFLPTGSVLQIENKFFIQETANDEHQMWLFWNMHSDWLQMIWEYGIASLVIALCLAGSLVWRLWGDPAPLSSLITMMTAATLNGPIRYFPLCLFLGFLCAYAIRRKNICYTNSRLV